MRITLKVLLVLFFSFTTFVGSLSAQGKVKEYVKVTTFKNEEFLGYIRKNNDKKIVLETSSAVIEIAKDKVKKVEYLKKKRKKNKVKHDAINSEYDNPEQESVESDKYSFPSKYAFGNTAYGLGKGQGYYHNYWVFYNDINYGITDNIAIGGGLMPFFFFAGAPSPFWIKAKFSAPIDKDKVNIAANIGVGTVLGGNYTRDDSPTNLILGGVITFGSKHKNLSLGINYIGAGEGGGTFINLGGKLKISRRSYLISELVFLSGEGGAVSFGGMTMFETLALDYGLIVPATGEREYLLAFPYLGVKIHFGENN